MPALPDEKHFAPVFGFPMIPYLTPQQAAIDASSMAQTTPQRPSMLAKFERRLVSAIESLNTPSGERRLSEKRHSDSLTVRRIMMVPQQPQQPDSINLGQRSIDGSRMATGGFGARLSINSIGSQFCGQFGKSCLSEI